MTECFRWRRDGILRMTAWRSWIPACAGMTRTSGD